MEYDTCNTSSAINKPDIKFNGDKFSKTNNNTNTEQNIGKSSGANNNMDANFDVSDNIISIKNISNIIILS